MYFHLWLYMCSFLLFSFSWIVWEALELKVTEFNLFRNEARLESEFRSCDIIVNEKDIFLILFYFKTKRTTEKRKIELNKKDEVFDHKNVMIFLSNIFNLHNHMRSCKAPLISIYYTFIYINWNELAAINWPIQHKLSQTKFFHFFHMI